LVQHPRARELYAPYLAVGHHVAAGMIYLMEAALAEARDLAPGDAVARGLATYLERHIPEERHGDEPGGGILADLAALGVDTEAVRAEPASPKIAALIGAVYYWIVHTHPVAVLGYLQLEAFQPDAMSIERLIQRTGLPRDGFRQLLLHAELDVGHAHELEHVIDSLPLEPWHERLIGLSALHTISMLTDAFLDVVEGAVVPRQPAFSDAL
jgi:hypothetical protein